MEMDPIIVRATRLLHSKSKDSSDQLRALLEEAIKQRYGDSKSLAHLNIPKPDPPKKESVSKYSSSSSSSTRKEERVSEKKRHEKMVEVTEPSPVKLPDLPKSKTASTRELETNKEVVVPMHIDNNDDDDDEDDDDDDDDDLALEIDDLSCVVCRGMNVSVCNNLVECLECHMLYHQECHQPPVAKVDMNDPRWAWYCATCTKAINKQPSKSRSSPKTVSSSSSHSSSHATAKPAQKALQDTVQNLFKRQDSKGSSGSSSKTSVAPLSSMGMAGLAASYQPASTTISASTSSKTAVSSSSSSKVVPPKVASSTVISVDKRLANMKKKAAKQQEKRKHIK